MVDQQFKDMQAQIDRRFAAVHESISENTALTIAADERSRRIETNTQALVDIFNRAGQSATFFARTERVLRSAAIWLGPFLTVGGIIWALAHGNPSKGSKNTAMPPGFSAAWAALIAWSGSIR